MMRILTDDLAEALEELEEGEKGKAHDIIEDHLEKATRMRRAVERLERLLDEHIDRLDDLSHRTEDVDLASIRESVDELRETMDGEERIKHAVKAMEESLDAD